MSLDRTQHQSTDEIRKARDLSIAPSRPPSQVSGYKLLKFLGSGAYGEVWSATVLKTGRQVAIKFYTRRSTKDVELLAREIEKLVVLSADRYVVQLLDVGWDADPPYFVMDYIEHGSLEDRLASHEGISTGDAIELFEELANGLMHLHDKGVLHCDLKPGNVLLDQDGKPRLADFGQSRLSTESVPALGTLFYMAPEQADLNAIPDARWDVYGLGALLYSMLTGEPPYYNPEFAKRIEKSGDIGDRLDQYREYLLASPMPKGHRAVKGVDRALAEIIESCIAANPKDRFNNIQSLLTSLRQRKVSKARLPMMILGFFGPILLIGVMSLVGSWAFREAVDKTRTEITNKAIESNRFASRLAARSAAEQIDEYFRVVGQLARDEKLLGTFEQVIRDPEIAELRAAIADPHDNYEKDTASEVIQAREALRKNSLRAELQPFLEVRLHDPQNEFPIAASWFINDRYGNQIASAFRSKNQTLAKNYAYRTYFTGLNEDLKEVDATSPDAPISFQVGDDIDQRKIIDSPHLSAVFLSEQSNTWKIAFATPLRIDGQVEGVVAVTVNLGNFIEFDNLSKQYAMLVDFRPGENRGIILEHPLFQEVLRSRGRLPKILATSKVDYEKISESRRFFDPVGETKIGLTNGYDSQTIVASAPVTMELQRFTPGEAIETNDPKKLRTETGLEVLAVEDYETIVRPANDLSLQLRRLALLAFFLLVGVSMGMWYFVRRLLEESWQRLEGGFVTSTEQSIKSMETVPANLPDTE